MPRTFFLLALLATAFCIVPPASAQDITTTIRHVSRTYTTRDGLPQATIQALEADRRGWLWAATQSGVAYNNGRHWQTLPALNRAMRTGFWQGRRILADDTGDMWFATHGDGLYHVHARPGAPPENWPWTRYSLAEGLPSDTVYALHKDTAGLLWAGTTHGLAVFRDSTWTRVPLPDTLVNTHFFAIHEEAGTLLAGTSAGLFRYENGAWNGPLLTGMLAHREVYALFEDHKGTLWAGLRGGIAQRVNGGVWQVVRAEAIDPSNYQNYSYVAIAEQADGTLGFGLRREGLLLRHRDGSWTTLDERNGLPSRHINALYQHPDGSYWIGTTSGLAVIRPDTWHIIDEANGLQSLWAIAEMRNGAMWFGSDRFTSIYEKGRWRTLQGPDGQPLAHTLAIHEAQDGRIWIGTRRGLYAYADGRWPLIERETYIYDILERADSTLLFGTQHGVWQYAEGRFTRFAPEQSFLDGPVRVVEQQADGTLWFGATRTGIARYDGQSWQFLTRDDGLPGNAVLDMFEDGHGLLWFATTEGLVTYNGTEFRVFTDETPVRLPDRFTYRVEQDRAGRYYVSTNKGIARLTLDPDHDAPAQSLDALDFTVEHFGVADGLPELEANQGASLRDSRGRIWFGLIAGAVMLDPGDASPSGTSLPLTIEHVDVANLADTTFAEHLRTANGPLALAHTQHDLTFAYTLGAPGNPDQVRYQTQLVGYDAEPSAWTQSVTRTYTNLPPGPYTFVVVGRSGTGPVSRPAEFVFHIARPLWATWWAYAIYCLLAGLAVAGLVHWQTERVRRRDAQQATLQQERLSRKVAEAETLLLRSENQRLAEKSQANEFKKRVLDSTTEAIFALNLDGELTLFNPRLEELSASTKKQLDGRPFTTLFTPASAKQVREAFETVLRDKAPVRALEVQLGLHERPYLSLTLSPLLTAGAVTSIIGLAEDITEKRRLEQFRDDMLRMLVHDLRSPLSVVQMISLELQANREMSPEIRAELAGMAVQNSEQALTLVNELLDISRLEAQQMPIKRKALALNDLTQHVADTLRPLFNEVGVVLTLDVSSQLPNVDADPSLLQRVLQNLLSNAARHTPRHGTVTLSAHSSGNQLTLHVTDTGPGIDPALHPHLFEKFASGIQGSGVGLGLAFCRLAVEAMGGKIWLDETVSAGAAFVFTLPCASPVGRPALPKRSTSF